MGVDGRVGLWAEAEGHAGTGHDAWHRDGRDGAHKSWRPGSDKVCAKVSRAPPIPSPLGQEIN